MNDTITISNELTVGGQPSAGDLEQLHRDGFKSIVNLRTEGEDDQALSPADEGEKARAAGLTYLHLPVSGANMRPEQVDEFRRELSALPKPVFVHCHKGKRAGAFTMMHLAVTAGQSGDETLQQAEQMGFQCDVPALKEFVKTYVDQNQAKS